MEDWAKAIGGDENAGGADEDLALVILPEDAFETFAGPKVDC